MMMSNLASSVLILILVAAAAASTAAPAQAQGKARVRVRVLDNAAAPAPTACAAAAAAVAAGTSQTWGPGGAVEAIAIAPGFCGASPSSPPPSSPSPSSGEEEVSAAPRSASSSLPSLLLLAAGFAAAAAASASSSSSSSSATSSSTSTSTSTSTSRSSSSVPLLAVLAALLLAAVAAAPAAAQLSRTYDNCFLLDGNAGYRFHWTVDAGAGALRVGLEAPISAGWLGWGVSPESGYGDAMRGGGFGADVVIGYPGTCAGRPSSLCVHDRWATTYALPELDAQDDVTPVAVATAGGSMYVEFDRPLAAGDGGVADRAIDPAVPETIIWAIQDGSTPSTPTVLDPHSTRGFVDIVLGNSQQCFATSPTDAVLEVDVATLFRDFDRAAFTADAATSLGVDPSRVVVEEVSEIPQIICPTCTTMDLNFGALSSLPGYYTIPTQETTYTCFAYEVTSAMNVVAFDTLVNNTEVTHHVVLYQVAPGAPAPELNAPFDCTEMPPGSQPLYGWAPGGEPVLLPSAASIPLGGSTGANYLVAQVHYNNPGLSVGERDASVVRLYSQATPRAEEAGFLFLGMDNREISLPPGQSEWHIGGECDPQAAGSGTINVFSWLTHMHFNGKSGWLEHMDTDGTTVVQEVSDEFYDYNNQKFEPVSMTVTPGQTLRAHCVFDTSNKTGITSGGDSTQEEMCLIVVLYYPKTLGGSCKTTQWSDGCARGYRNYDRAQCEQLPTGGACADIRNCSACDAAPQCGWCESATFSGCVANSPTLGDACVSQLGGAFNNCGVAGLGTNCTRTHTDCASCSADTANNCAWCRDNLNPTVGTCLATDGSAQQNAQAGGVCNAFGGSPITAGSC